MIDVVILTDDRFVHPKEESLLITNALREDQMVQEALVARGLNCEKVSWSDPTFDWTKTRYALFRTTWDYAESFTEFSEWLLTVSSKTKLINPYPQIVWNLDKHYLRDLQASGVNVVETYFIESGDRRSLAQIHDELEWDRTVLKPVISAAAKDTYKLDASNLIHHEARFQELVNNESMMLQPFLTSVVDRGELSLMVIGGVYTHAVLKIAKPGDFRVQDDFGGTVHAFNPSREEIDLAISAVRACDPMPIYARVDIVNDNDGNPAVSELELVEPELWFRRNPNAAMMLAEEIENMIVHG